MKREVGDVRIDEAVPATCMADIPDGDVGVHRVNGPARGTLAKPDALVAARSVPGAGKYSSGRCREFDGVIRPVESLATPRGRCQFHRLDNEPRAIRSVRAIGLAIVEQHVRHCRQARPDQPPSMITALGDEISVCDPRPVHAIILAGLAVGGDQILLPRRSQGHRWCCCPRRASAA
jgi:hypothetical protein